MTGRARAVGVAGGPLEVPAGAGRMGFRRVLVPLGASRRAWPALAAAVAATDRLSGRVRVVHVRTWLPLPPPPREGEGMFVGDGDLYSETPAQASEVVDTALGDLHRMGVPAEGAVVEAARPLVGDAIAVAAREWDADLIVLCRRPRRAVGVWFTGSVSELVMSGAPCPVLVLRAGTA